MCVVLPHPKSPEALLLSRLATADYPVPETQIPREPGISSKQMVHRLRFFGFPIEEHFRTLSEREYSLKRESLSIEQRRELRAFAAVVQSSSGVRNKTPEGYRKFGARS